MFFKRIPWLQPFDNWLNRTFLVWATCVVLMVVVSLLTKAPAPAAIKDIIWSVECARLPKAERDRNRGIRSLFLWWAVFIGIMAVLYAYLVWFQFLGPGRH